MAKSAPPGATPYTPITSCEFLCTRPRKDKEKYECMCGVDSPCDDAETCLNRAIFIECSRRCHLGDRCRNRRLQKREFADVEVRPAGKKGHGIFLASGQLHEGDLVGEYVGEVIDKIEFARRKAVYREKGHEHLYFMNLDAERVIDSTVKGCFTRFTNHSCDPNMVLEKWTVNGEIRMGLYAGRTIETGEELVFDYKYERIDERSHPCYCGSDNCRGELDAKVDPTNASRGAAERALKRLHHSLEELCDGEAGLRMDSVLELLKILRSTYQTDHRAVILEFLCSPITPAVLNTFLRFRGLQFLRMYLDDFVDGGADDLMPLMMRVLTSLPVGTRNVADQSGILQVLKRLGESREDSIRADATRLHHTWSALEEVAVIEKRADAADPIEMPIPRRLLSKFREAALRRIEQRTGARLVFTKFNDDPEHKRLKVSGSEQDIDSAKHELERALVAAHADEKEAMAREAQEAERQVYRSIAKEREAKAAESRKRRLSSEDGPAAAAGEADLLEGWKMAIDDRDGRAYFWNESDPSNVTWERPVATRADAVKKVKMADDKLAIGISDESMAQAIAEFSREAREAKAVAKPSDMKEAKEERRKKMKQAIAETVGKVLKRYRQPDCKIGRISNDADYKHLCRRLTHEIMKKEQGPEVDDATRHKIKNFVKGYMKKIGPKGFSRAGSSP
mmetsp:Transcript_24583/g.73705  ORF Transcript_24583/g.73705 Transcript_24583/m.73705 type:complete len:680 (+) Transcript_24583:187-2226(+)